MRTAVTRAQHRLDRIDEKLRSAENADRSDRRAGRRKAGGTATLQRTARAEWTSRSVSVRDIHGRTRVGALARADLTDAGRAEIGGPSHGRKHRQDRSERNRIGDGERDQPAADQAIHGVNVGSELCGVHRREAAARIRAQAEAGYRRLS